MNRIHQLRRIVRKSLKLTEITALAAAAAAAGFLLFTGVVYSWYFADHITPHTSVGAVALGGLSRDDAAGRLQSALDGLDHSGIPLTVEGEVEVIQPDAIGLDMNLAEAIDQAFARGHQGGAVRRLWERVAALWSDRHLPAPMIMDESALKRQVDEIADVHDRGRRDIRLEVTGTHVDLLTDTLPGKVIDREGAVSRIRESLAALDGQPIALELRDDPPQTDPASGPIAVADAQKIMSRGLTLIYEDIQFTINREKIGSWLTNEYRSDTDNGVVQLSPGLDGDLIATYVTSVAKGLNVDPIPPQISTTEGRVTGFVPPKVGRAVEEDKLVELITASLTGRTGKDRGPDVITVPLKTSKMALTGLDAESGITEIIGKATTTFAGSPKNRIFNIKNGVKFLSGILVQPGEEFSTLGTLGHIDNTSGYLPELVIKGDRTTPEFGGGLCQVSTTLFRAVMDAGLPITARRNHSFRVGYYEKDGNGKVIGPGLDATIYEPEVDFKFVNDTANPILVIGYVVGTQVTFELYGTGDGRTSQIIGPKILTEIPAGEPVYIETLDLAPGVTKQVEFPHPGGSTIATYSVTYPDGRINNQDFTSWYRRWPAKYLKGVTVLSTPTPTPPVSPPLP